jgi:hypothetical protein
MNAEFAARRKQGAGVARIALMLAALVLPGMAPGQQAGGQTAQQASPPSAAAQAKAGQAGSAQATPGETKTGQAKSAAGNGRSGSPGAKAALPKAETVLERFVEVTGGIAAYQSHKTETMTGTMSFQAMGISGAITRYSAPGKEYSSVDLGPMVGKMEQGVLDGWAWDKTSVLGPRLKAGAERDFAVRESEFNGAVEWKKYYSKVETKGREAVNGEDCYQVVLTPKSGKPETHFYSVKSGLLLKSLTIAETQLGDVPAEIEYSDYKRFGGVLTATKSKQRAAGQEFTVEITDVRVNEPIPDAQFEPPDDVRVLITKAKMNNTIDVMPR